MHHLSMLVLFNFLRECGARSSSEGSHMKSNITTKGHILSLFVRILFFKYTGKSCIMKIIYMQKKKKKS